MKKKKVNETFVSTNADIFNDSIENKTNHTIMWWYIPLAGKNGIVSNLI